MPEVATSRAIGVPAHTSPLLVALLRPKWQMARHRSRRRAPGDTRRLVVVGILGLAFWSATFFIALRMLRYFRSAEDIGALLAGKLLSMIFLAFSSILLLSNLIASLSCFYLARDLDALAAAPVSPRALYGARLAETTLHSSWMVALLLVPVTAAYGTAYAGGVAFVPVALAILLPYLVIPAAAGAIVTTLLVNVFPARRTRDLLAVISALAVAALVVMFRMARPEQLARPEGFQNFMEFVAALDAPSSPWLPSEWASDGMMRWLRGESVWNALARLWGASAMLVVAGSVLHGQLWTRGFSQAQEGAMRARGGSHPRSPLERIFAFAGPTRRQLVVKELRVFARDSTQWSQLVMLGVLVVVYVANVRYLPLSGEGMTTLLRNVLPFLNLALAGFVLASVAARFVFPAVSLEGRVLWLLRSSPLSMRELLLAKFWTGVFPLLALALILVGATNTLLGVRPFVQVVSLGAIAALVFPLVALALGYGAAYPRFDSENAAQIPTSFGGLLYMMTAVALIGLVAYLTGRPAARYVVAEHFGRVVDASTLIVPFAAAAAVCAVITMGALAIATRRLDALERA